MRNVINVVRGFDYVTTAGELLEVLGRVPPDTRVVNSGHYGEVDMELDGASIGTINGETVVVLNGFSPSYPEPD